MATATATRTAPSRSSGTKTEAPAKSKAHKPQIVRAGKSTPSSKSESPTSNMKATEPDAIDSRFKAAAEKLDGKIVAKIQSIGKDIISLGEMFSEMQEKGYHRALGFAQFRDYVTARYPDNSPSQVFQAMRVVRELTSGENPVVSKDDVRQMTRDNAEGLVKLKKEGVKITPAFIESAKLLPARRFQEEVMFPAAPNLKTRADANAGNNVKPLPQQRAGGYAASENTGAQGEGPATTESAPAAAEAGTTGVIIMRKIYDLQSDTVAEMKRCEEIFRYVGRDSTTKLPWTDQFFQSLCAEYRATHEAEYESWLAMQEAEGEAAENLTKEQMAVQTVSEDDLEEEIIETRSVEYESESQLETVA